MNNLEELLNLCKVLEKESKDININDISQVISFLEKYIDCQRKIITTFKEEYDKKNIELSKYKQVIGILKEKEINVCKDTYIDEELGTERVDYILNCNYVPICFIKKEYYELLKEVLGNE